MAYAEQDNEIQSLPKITVTANQNANLQNSVNLTGFTEQTIAKIPASIHVVTAEQIADQHAKTLKDIVKNDAAVGEGYARWSC